MVEGSFSKNTEVLPQYYHNGSVVVSDDFDNDGDEDFFVGSRSVTNSFGKMPESYLLVNENGRLTIDSDQPLSDCGMVTDALLFDFDNDNDKDLIVVSEWSEVMAYINNNGTFVNYTKNIFLILPKGLWQSVEIFDIDKDGINEIVVGNVGLNSKFSASDLNPLKMYV